MGASSAIASAVVAPRPPMAWRSSAVPFSPPSSKMLRPLRIHQAAMHMHAAAGAVQIGLGHEAGGEAMARRHRLDDALEQDGVIARATASVVIQVDLELARRILRDRGRSRTSASWPHRPRRARNRHRCRGRRWNRAGASNRARRSRARSAATVRPSRRACDPSDRIPFPPRPRREPALGKALPSRASTWRGSTRQGWFACSGMVSITCAVGSRAQGTGVSEPLTGKALPSGSPRNSERPPGSRSSPVTSRK